MFIVEELRKLESICSLDLKNVYNVLKFKCRDLSQLLILACDHSSSCFEDVSSFPFEKSFDKPFLFEFLQKIYGILSSSNGILFIFLLSYCTICIYHFLKIRL